MSQFGPAFEAATDSERVRTQMLRVRDFMLAQAIMGRWLTLAEIRHGLEDAWHNRFPEASVSAQLRHLRKPAFGSYDVQKRRRGYAGAGIWEYRLTTPEWKPAEQLDLIRGIHDSSHLL